jgi:hypothetical protein
MLSRLLEWWREPATNWVARLRTSEFLTDARLEPCLNEGYSHVLVLEFSEPVRDGNDLSHYNLRGGEGVAVASFEPATGDVADRLEVNPGDLPPVFDVVFVTRGGEVHAADRVELAEVPVEETEV